MSVSLLFEFRVVKRENFTSVNLIESFLKEGWNLYSEKGEIIYTDIGDIDDYDYKANRISEKEYFNIVIQKERNNETIAFTLYWLEADDRYRIDVLITPQFEILISPDDETKKMIESEIKILDVNWYLYRILMTLTNNNILVEGYSFQQY